MKTPFSGFPPGKVRFTSIPGPFFSQLLPQIDHLGELKVTLYAFWRLGRMEGAFRYLSVHDFLEDEDFIAGLGEEKLEEALEHAVRRGTLLDVVVELEDGPERFYFLNTVRGQAAVEAVINGDWKPSGDARHPLELVVDRPNIYKLYEANIGTLTPMIADTLRAAEEAYPPIWIEEALQIAIENNVRRWRYVEAILKSWKEEGKDERTVGGDTEKDRRKYVEGQFSEFIEH
ncbi:MAG: DnaD domain protein [Anaerolineae bacterium]|nr:DnaD domain protein [Anaerolineae bacterium]